MSFFSGKRTCLVMVAMVLLLTAILKPRPIRAHTWEKRDQAVECNGTGSGVGSGFHGFSASRSCAGGNGAPPCGHRKKTCSASSGGIVLLQKRALVITRSKKKEGEDTNEDP